MATDDAARTFCGAEIRWPGHPSGWVLCDRMRGHRGRHHALWQGSSDGEGWHRLQWTDALADAAKWGEYP